MGSGSRRVGVEVRPGSIREARLDAGLSLAQLAGGDVSRQAIHQIETGRSRPTPRTLELIAERTGRSISEFLSSPGEPVSPEAALRELRLMCAQRRHREAIELACEMLASRPLQRVADEMRFWLGQALVSVMRPDEAIPHLQAARVGAEAAGDPWRAVECLDWEAGALYAKEDPRALIVAEEALARCRQLEPRPPGLEARVLEHLAAIHVRNRSIDSAVAHYEAALAAAEGVHDLARKARTYHGLSMAYQERGLLDQAAAYAERAHALYALENDHVLIARAENELGLILMRKGEPDKAEAMFTSALRHLEAAGLAQLRSHVVLSRAELHLARGEVQRAEAAVREAIQLAAAAGERLALATGRVLLGRTLAARGDGAGARPEFEAAIATLEELGTRERLAEAHAEYARALESLGDVGEAARNWRRAAQLALRRLDAAERAAAG